MISKNRIGLASEKGFLLDDNSVVFNYNDAEGNKISDKKEIAKLLTPKAFTKSKLYKSVKLSDAAGDLDKIGALKLKEIELKEIARDENLLIKGDNLLVMHSLKQRFAKKVKLIYIDPPYNTGKDDFGYNDNLSHYNWLIFMKNRLEVAKELLRDDGAIFVQIDRYEQAYLNVLMDEIFGRRNFINNIVWQRSVGNNINKHFTTNHDTILVYAKNKKNWSANLLPRRGDSPDFGLGEGVRERYSNPDNDPRGVWSTNDMTASKANKSAQYEIKGPTGKVFLPGQNRSWSVSKEKYQELLKDNRITFGKNNQATPRTKLFLSEAKPGIIPRTLWFNKDMQQEETLSKKDKELWNMTLNYKGKNDIKTLKLDQLFTTVKPEHLLHRIIHIASDPGDIILDFFAGSGSTASVAHKMKRQWIAIERLDYIKDITLERLKKVVLGEDKSGISKGVNWNGGGSFIYTELDVDRKTCADK